ncbi:hypothetical protein BCE75_10998 [Isoptericola sp. CG 20/1183]|uniref:ATP synthase protein I n=1 Tax=Isoptericola halotolerans TaxID=300560 RepID=A0ABX5EE79_9MICO|nr:MULTISPECIES: hypothetical protein [Isoptericola]PRZ04860.1 hypothetical protein BCL65_10999 [Isoptericola halotolerans]PRZ05351.1 hypothetical protein BCE75_10998 [Isoptericola sp. CG 20/1183]
MTAQPPVPDNPDETADQQPATSGRSFDEVQAGERAMLRRAMRSTLLLVGALVVLGCAVGALVAGLPGVWGALVGAGLAAFFCGTTVWSMQRTVGKPPTVMAGVVMGAWLAKIVVLVVVLAVLRGADFYDPYVLFVVLAIGAIGSALLDYQAVKGARIPYVQT